MVRHSWRPRLEQLENRLVPAPLIGALAGAGPVSAIVPAGQAAPSSPGGESVEKGMTLTAPPSQIDVAVTMNAGATVYDLSKVLAGWEGWQYHDPPRLSIVRNTNRNLVTAGLTDNDLKLSFAAGQTGTASVTVGLTDAADVSIQVTFVITVQPPPVLQITQIPPMKLPSGPNPLAD